MSSISLQIALGELNVWVSFRSSKHLEPVVVLATRLISSMTESCSAVLSSTVASSHNRCAHLSSLGDSAVPSRCSGQVAADLDEGLRGSVHGTGMFPEGRGAGRTQEWRPHAYSTCGAAYKTSPVAGSAIS